MKKSIKLFQKIDDKYALKRLENINVDFDIDNISKISNYRVIMSYSNKNIKDEDLKEKITKFIKIMKSNFPLDYLNNLFNNISWVDIILDSNKKNYKKGTYKIRENKIILVDKNYDQAFFHELLHLTSTNFISTNAVASGFLYKTPEFSFGKALNEGYTELMKYKIFRYEPSSAYKYFFDIAMILDDIIGYEKMEKFYLTANVKGLIEELEVYYTKEEIKDFFINLDFILKLYNEKGIIVEEKINEYKMNISKFLMKAIKKTNMNVNYDLFELSMDAINNSVKQSGR